MDTNLYLTHSQIQRKHWWFVVKTKIVNDTIRKYFVRKGDKNKKILDIGCGAGLMLESLSEYGVTYGMDTSDEAISFCKKNFKGVVAKGHLPDGVPFEQKYFDLIVSLDVIEHVDDDVGALETMKNILADDGKIVLTVPACMSLWSMHDVVNHHKRRYTLPELKTKLEKVGFNIEKISYYNTLLFPVVYVIRKINNVFKRDSESDFDVPSKGMNFILKGIFGVEKYILRLFNQPIGVSIIAVVKKQ